MTICVMGLSWNYSGGIPAREKKIMENMKDLVERAQRGDIAARNAVVTANMNLVFVIARRVGRGAPQHLHEDLVSEGTLGLIRAVDTWDPQGKTAWTTHAGWKIRDAVSWFKMEHDGIKARGSQVHRKIARGISKVQHAREAQGLTCTPEDLAEALGVKVGTILEYLARSTTTSMDEIKNAHQTTFPIPGEPTVEDEERQKETWLLRLKSYAQGLDGIKGAVLRGRLKGESTEELCQRLGIGRGKLYLAQKAAYQDARAAILQP